MIVPGAGIFVQAKAQRASLVGQMTDAQRWHARKDPARHDQIGPKAV